MSIGHCERLGCVGILRASCLSGHSCECGSCCDCEQMPTKQWFCLTLCQRYIGVSSLTPPLQPFWMECAGTCMQLLIYFLSCHSCWICLEVIIGYYVLLLKDFHEMCVPDHWSFCDMKTLKKSNWRLHETGSGSLGKRTMLQRWRCWWIEDTCD